MKLPGREPEKVEARVDGDDAGLLLVQCEAPFGEECFDFGAYVPFQNFLRRCCHEKSSSGGELHPSALTEPDVRLSPHPAPTLQPRVAHRVATGQTDWGPAARCV